jgi:DNA-binding PucR family transcriptional regulator
MAHLIDHPYTMYRLSKIEALVHIDLGDADIRFMLQPALRANRAVADASCS